MMYVLKGSEHAIFSIFLDQEDLPRSFQREHHASKFFFFFFFWVCFARDSEHHLNFLSNSTLIRIIGFDHRKRSRSLILYKEDWDENLLFHVNLEKSSSVAVYEYFSSKLTEICSDDVSASVIYDLYSCFLFRWAVSIQVTDAISISQIMFITL